MSKRIPQFKTDEEAEKFLEQDLSDYLDPAYMVPLRFEFRPKDTQQAVEKVSGECKTRQKLANKRSVHAST